MNQPIKTYSKILLSLCLILAITNCSSINEFPTTSVSVIDSRENSTNAHESENHGQMDSTKTPFVTSSTQTAISATTDSVLSGEYPQVSQTCIGNFSDFAYSGAMDTKTQIQQPVLPLHPWKEVIEFPRNSDNKETYYLVAALQYKGNIEIWVKNYITHKTIILNPETMEQEVISSGSIGYPGLEFGPSFILSDGTVWGRSLISSDSNRIVYDSFPPLCRYNEETRQFEIPENMFTVSLHEVSSDYPELPLIYLDKDDTFWIFAQHEGLFQYDTRTGETKIVLQTPDLEFRNGVMDQQGGIYFNSPTIGYYPVEGLKSGQILYFNPVSEKLEPVLTPEQHWPIVFSLFVDSEERIWTDISGYRDKDGEWTLLHNNIDEYFKKFNILQSWHVPSVEIQTSDGRLWVERQYSYYNQGTAWFDPETGDGCWFTSYNSTIVEDANNTLWFEADGKLYKNELMP